MRFSNSKNIVLKLIDLLFCESVDLQKINYSLQTLLNELYADAIWLSHWNVYTSELVASCGLDSDIENLEKIIHRNCQCRQLANSLDKKYEIYYLEKCSYISEFLKKKVKFYYHYSIPLRFNSELIGVLNIAYSKKKKISENLLVLLSKIYSAVFSNYIFYKKLEDQRKELAKKNNELEVIVSAISHDLKTPIISAKGFLKIIKDKYGDRLNKGMEWYLQCIENSVARTEELVKDLLNLSKIDKILNSREDVFIKDTIKASIRNISYLIKNRKPKIIINCQNIKIYSNWHALFHIFTNLIANAVKYTPDNRKPVIEVSCECLNEGVLIKVKDNGIGLTEREVQDIFKPFNRIKTLDREGSGVGLSIVKRIVEGLGGNISVESRKNVGSTFCLRIPTEIINAEGEIRTRTGFTPLDPESSVSASSTTSAMNTLYFDYQKRSRN